MIALVRGVKLFYAWGLLFFCWLSTGQALAPHRAALLVNQNDADSMALANQYGAWRGIPPENFIYLDVPARALSANPVVTRQDFDDHILRPALNLLQERGLEDKIICWVYSSGFPTTIRAETTVSIHGYTLVRGQLPEKEWIKKGRAVNPLFCGVKGQGDPESFRPPVPFAAWHLMMGTNMPLPSMTLSHLGTRGLTKEQALIHLQTGLSADALNRQGVIYFDTGKDIRAKTRAFQIQDVEPVLKAGGFKILKSSDLPARNTPLSGAMLGRPMVPAHMVGTFLPGAYADHLTSFGAMFSQYQQTKCVNWLKAGAVATSGTVTEPMAIWTKFPSARIFELQAAGLAMIEALYGATASPFQTLFLGDPLCRPFGRPVPLTLFSMSGENVIREPVEFRVQPLSGDAVTNFVWSFFLNGRSLNAPGIRPSVTLKATDVPAGFHRLDVEAVHRENPLIQGVASLELEVPKKNQEVVVEGPKGQIDSLRPFPVTVRASTEAESVGLEVQGRTIRTKKGHEAVFQLDPKHWGSGPVSWRGVALFPGDKRVFTSVNQWFGEPVNTAPRILSKTQTKSGGVSFDVKDAEGDENMAFPWLTLVHGPVELERWDEPSAVSRATIDEKKFSLQPVGLLEKEVRGVRAEFHPNAKGRLAMRNPFGLTFSAKDEDNFEFFGYGGVIGTFVLARQTAGTWEVQHSVGMPVRDRVSYTFELLHDGSGWRYYVNGDAVQFPGADQPFTKGEMGILAAGDVRIEDPAWYIPEARLEISKKPPSGSWRWVVDAVDEFGARQSVRMEEISWSNEEE